MDESGLLLKKNLNKVRNKLEGGVCLDVGILGQELLKEQPDAENGDAIRLDESSQCGEGHGTMW